MKLVEEPEVARFVGQSVHERSLAFGVLRHDRTYRQRCSVLQCNRPDKLDGVGVNRHVPITRCRLLPGIDDDAGVQHLCVPIYGDDGIECQRAHPRKRTNQRGNLQQHAVQCPLLGLATYPIRSNRRQRRMDEIGGKALIERRQHQRARGAGLHRMRTSTQRDDGSE